jgi:hypothetical protein
MIGTTRSRVSYFMTKFRKLGLISYSGSIEVHSSGLNLVLHEEPHNPDLNVLDTQAPESAQRTALCEKKTI